MDPTEQIDPAPESRLQRYYAATLGSPRKSSVVWQAVEAQLGEQAEQGEQGEHDGQASAAFTISQSGPHAKEQAAAKAKAKANTRGLSQRMASKPKVNHRARTLWLSPAIAVAALMVLLILGGMQLGLFTTTNGEPGGAKGGLSVPPNPAPTTREITFTNPGFEDKLTGWAFSANTKSDATVAHTGKRSATIASQDPEAIFSDIQQSVDAVNLRGERIRLSGYLKTRDVNGMSELWMSVGGPISEGKDFGPPLAFDNMAARPVTGTEDWGRYELVLDVPYSATAVYFGPWLWGTGQMWADDLRLEIVSKDVPSTDMYLNGHLSNTGFENGLSPWFWSGQHMQKYKVGTDSQVQHSGNASGYLSMITPTLATLATTATVTTAANDEQAAIQQIVNAQAYAGKRIRFSAYLKTQDVKNWAGLEVQVNDLLGNTLSQGNMEGSPNPVHGTTAWQKYEIEVDVPTNAFLIYFGVRLDGTGILWIDDARLVIEGKP